MAFRPLAVHAIGYIPPHGVSQDAAGVEQEFNSMSYVSTMCYIPGTALDVTHGSFHSLPNNLMDLAITNILILQTVKQRCRRVKVTQLISKRART